jgi:hypothetical protein
MTNGNDGYPADHKYCAHTKPAGKANQGFAIFKKGVRSERADLNQQSMRSKGKEKEGKKRRTGRLSVPRRADEGKREREDGSSQTRKSAGQEDDKRDEG